jgi:hypothetical protein
MALIEIPDATLKSIRLEMWYGEEEEAGAVRILTCADQELMSIFIDRHTAGISHVNPAQVNEHFEQCLKSVRESERGGNE